MNRLKALLATALAIVAIPAAAQSRRVSAQNFASDFQTVPVMSNTTGVNGATFQTFVALLNPTSSAFAVEATLYDANGTKRTATINLAAGELRTYTNFLDAVFHYSGGGAVTFRAPDSAGGTHNNRFVVNAEVWTTTGGRYGTPISVLEFAGTASRSFSPGITVDWSARTNVGCFNQTDAANKVKATILDATGKLTLGSVELNLPANGWGQTAALNTVVSGGSVQFDPSDSAVCYAVVVDNKTNDGRFISAAEYLP